MFYTFVMKVYVEPGWSLSHVPWNIQRVGSHVIEFSYFISFLFFVVYHLCPSLCTVYYHYLPTPNSLIYWNSRNVCSIHSCWKCMLNQGSPWVICLETYIGWFHMCLNSHTIFPSCFFMVLSSWSSIVYCVLTLSLCHIYNFLFLSYIHLLYS